MLVALAAEPGLERGAIVAGLALIQMDGDELERHRRALTRPLEQVKQRVAVLASTDCDHDPIARLDELEVRNAPPHFVSQSLFEGGLHRNYFARRIATARACASRPSRRASPSRRSPCFAIAARE